MSSHFAEANADSLTLAAALYRAPSRHPELLHGHRPLPPGVTALLQAAAGNYPTTATKAANMPAGELQQAALFFIEQVLLARHASHYRTLGVEPGAAIAEIKEHHRLLMRLFHPDRQTKPDARSDAIATRINQAYNVLRSTDTRAAYDLTLVDKQEMKPPGANHPRRQPVEAIPDLPIHPPSFVTRHRTSVALGSVALFASLSVMLVYVNRVPSGSIGAHDAHFTRATENETARHASPELPPAVARALAEPQQVESSPPTAILSAATETQHVTAATRKSSERDPMVVPVAAKTALVKAAPSHATAPASVRKPLPPPLPVAVAVAATDSAPVAVNPSEVPEIKLERIRPEQLNSLIASLAEQYQRGDLENLLALFDASAHMERGDKKQIRAEYGDLFRSSESRALHIWDVAWSGDSRLMRGVGSFQASVLRKGDNKPHIYNGAVTIEVIQRNDRPLIVGLYHKPDN